MKHLFLICVLALAAAAFTVPSHRRIVAVSVSSSGFVPPSGLVLWLDASQIVGLNDDDAVATWEDASGQNNDATQGTPAARPTYKTDIINGLPVMRFDGVDDTLTTISNIDTVGTIVFVLQATVFGGTAPPVASKPLEPQRLATFYPNLTTIFSGNAGDVFTTQQNCFIDGVDTNTFPAGFHCATVVSTAGAKAWGAVMIIARATINGYLGADIAEILVFDTALSTENRQLVENYLLAKYGLP